MKAKIANSINIADNLIWLGIGFSALFWILESALHAFIFNEENLIRHVFTPDINEIWMRILIVALFILFSIRAQFFINQIKRVEEALRTSEKGLATTLNAFGDAVITTDAEGRVVHMNPVAENLTGRNFSESKRRLINEIFPIFNEKNRNTMENPAVRVLSEDIVVGPANHAVLISNKGSELPIDYSAAPIKNDRDQIRGAVFVFREITEKKQAEKALRESEEKYRLLVENASDAIFIVQDERIKFQNPKVVELTGYSAEELFPAPFVNFIYPDDRDMVLKRYKRRLAGKIEPTTYSFRIITKSGKQLWIQVNDTLISWNDQPAVLAFMRDITPQKRIEAQLRQSQKMEAIGTLAGGIAHDFNNILAAIMGYTELALSDIEKETLTYNNLQEALQAGERAKDLVRQILTFSRHAEQERKPVQIKRIAREALKLLRASIPTTIEIRQELQSDALVLADPTQIHQVLMNLCTNAEHAMRQKGGVLTVELKNVELDAGFTSGHQGLKPGAYLDLTVSDTGCGMPSHVLDRIFDPFFTTKAHGVGTGMGLSVVHGIINSYDGTIAAYSEPGQGTSFKIYLPVIERQLASETMPSASIPTGNERVLFVDDEAALANISKQTLESLGYDVTTRTSSIEALELFKTRPDRFDLVITDMTMPDMTGEDLAAELMRIKPATPVILCTGFSTKIDNKKAMAMGIRAFVSKPVLIKEIAETIRNVLDGKSKP